MKTFAILLCLLTTSFAAAPARPNALPAEAVSAIKTGTKFVLFSLEPPSAPDFKVPDPKTEENHHGFKILGSIELADAPSRASAVAAIVDAVRAFNGGVAACFEPRHSLRVISASGITYDFVACFECASIRVYRGNESIGDAGITGSQKRLDDLLLREKIPLAKPHSVK